jgi:hypothetical protein
LRGGHTVDAFAGVQIAPVMEHRPYVVQSESIVQVVAVSMLQWPVLPAHCVAWFASVQVCVLGG